VKRNCCLELLITIAIALDGNALVSQDAPATQLNAGMAMARALQATDEHVYTAQLESGAAIFGQADQQGIDLVIDVYAPDGEQLMRLDTPNGSSGPESINFTALQAGMYKFVIHTLDKNAKPGKYVMQVDQILKPAENAKRLAKLAYPLPALYDLWEASQTDPTAVDRFFANRKGKTPMLDATPISSSEMRVTYVCQANQDTERVVMHGGPEFGVLMRRLGNTNLFLGTQIVPNDARFEYSFALREVHHAGLRGEVEIAQAIQQGPWLLEMPKAPAQPYIVAKDEVPKGKTIQATIKSTTLNEDRNIGVYTPAGYDGKTANNLLIVFDGPTYGALAEQTEVPTPTILDNMIAEKKIAPTIAVLVWSMGKRNRDLNGSKPFADFIASELVPWVRSHYNILPGPGSVVVAGSSSGGFAATYCAFHHPEAIGNVLSQSGAYWITKDWQNVLPLYPRDTGSMIEELKSSKQLPIRFYMEVGRYDLGAAFLGSNRELRDVLQVKGYDVDYHEFDGGHEYVNWRGSLADGLVSLLGQKRN
jgi:enterochelin esterase-like enzyme